MSYLIFLADISDRSDISVASDTSDPWYRSLCVGRSGFTCGEKHPLFSHGAELSFRPSTLPNATGCMHNKRTEQEQRERA